MNEVEREEEERLERYVCGDSLVEGCGEDEECPDEEGDDFREKVECVEWEG